MKIIGDGGHAKVIRGLVAAARYQFSDEWCFIAVGTNKFRKKEAEANSQYLFPILVHPFSWVSPDAVIGEGTIIMAGVVIQPNVKIGKHCIINTGASLDHDSYLEDYVHVAPGARLCGAVRANEGAFISSGAICVPGAKVEAWTQVKAGTVFKSAEWRENYKLLAEVK